MSDGPAKKPTGSLIPVLIVLVFGLGLILAVIAVAGPAGLFIVLAIAAVLAFAGLHYVLWGWWLSPRIRDSDKSESTDDQ
ncbi:MAG TPA: hypothetical protein VHV08_04135 [Pirellulales bacterium]|nr:hypothetical protein [Pirellulales bacterium]